MEIILDSLIEGARKARGTVIIIDVFRAFTTASIAFQRGATRILMTAEVPEALRLKQEGLGDLCMGEVDGLRPEGFEYGNSPHSLSLADVKGKTIIQSTRAGTVGVTSARNANRILAGSLTNAEATIQTILDENPSLLTIVAMGSGGKIRADEDEQCALYLRNRLEGRRPDKKTLRSLILDSQWAQNFDEPDLPHKHPNDRNLALSIDYTPFAIEVKNEDGLSVAYPVKI